MRRGVALSGLSLGRIRVAMRAGMKKSTLWRGTRNATEVELRVAAWLKMRTALC